MYKHMVVHIPHSSYHIPDEYMDSFLIQGEELFRQQLFMSDSFTDELFHHESVCGTYIVNPVTRLLCDVERFRDDKDEYNARLGHGLMYTRGALGKKLRAYDPELRGRILRDFYDPHHEKLTLAVDRALAENGTCTILDGHSFNSVWPIKPDCLFRRPDICIGTDSFHTPVELRDAMLEACRREGFYPRVNTPYCGAITPMKYYGSEKRVVSVMVEVNRKLYMNEKTGEKTSDFEAVRELCRKLMETAAEYKYGR